VSGAVYALACAYVIFFAWLSIQRHASLQSNAMDLGYTDQVVWNTVHGRFLRFSTLQNAPIDLPLEQFRRTDVLLAYHVELLLVPISLLYLIYESPITLLVLQALVVGLGALPVYWLARDRLESDWAGGGFAAAYLLAPALQGALLSDFHAVTMTPTLLLFGFYCLYTQRYAGFLVCMALSTLAKEDIPLLVATIGAYALVFAAWIIEDRRERRRTRIVGAIALGLGLGWFVVAIRVIQPAYHGLLTSPFMHRLTLFGPTPKASLLNLLRDPRPLWRWLIRPEIRAYLLGLLASGGFMSLFSPVLLSLSVPVVAMNVFSTWDWTYSEGAHYSASIMAFVFVSGISGLSFLARQLARRRKLSHTWTVNVLAAVVLLVAGYHHVQIGISPFSSSYSRPRITDHHRLVRKMIALIPPDAALSTQSGLYPHLSHRQKAYFFPAINDAEYVLLDVTGPSYPITLPEVHSTATRLVDSGQFGVLAAEDGYLLLQRGLAGPSALPDGFYNFGRADEQAIPHPLRARFGDTIELLGYDYTLHNAVHAQQLPATITTYWRPLRPLEDDLRLVFFFSREDGAIVYHYDQLEPIALWYPPSRWPVGSIVRVDTPTLSVGRLKDTMVAVVPDASDVWSTEARLKPQPSGDGQGLVTYDQDTLLKLFAFP
jgi:uncharacterized membrane protein